VNKRTATLFKYPQLTQGTLVLRCIECEASFALSNGTRYQCSSHHEGGNSACDVSLSLPRERAERYILNCVETSLLDPKRVAEFEARYLSSRPPTVDYRPRIVELERQIKNFVKMIGAGGGLRLLWAPR
jgi:hypothetical protein